MSNNYVSALVVFVILNLASAYAQTVYSKVFNISIGNESCTANAVVSAYNNGYILVGEANNDGLVARLDFEGAVIWGKTIGKNTRWSNIEQTADSAYFVVGSGNNGEGYIMKIDSNGNIIWHRTIATNVALRIQSGHPTFDHGFIITGYKSNVTAPYTNLFVSKLDSLGYTEWSEFLTAGNNTNLGKVVRQMPDSTYIIAGYVLDSPPSDPGAFLLKLDAVGTVIFGNKYSLVNQEYFTAQDLIISDTTLIVLCDDGINTSTYILKTDLNGDLLSSKMGATFGNGEEGDGNLKLSSDGGIYFVHGSCWGSAIIKLDSQFQLVFGKSISLATIGIIPTIDNGYIIAGYGPLCTVKLNDNLGYQIGIIKTDSLGNALMCVNGDIINPTVNTVLLSNAITFTSTVGAASVLSVPAIDAIELIASDGCVVSGVLDGQTTKNSFEIYPNPVSTSGTISFSLKKNTHVILEFRDLIGREMIRLINENLESGEHNVKFNRNKFSSGIYILQMKMGKEIFVKKVAIQ